MTATLRLLACILLILMVGCGGADDRKAAYIAKGRELFSAGNYEKARLEFKNAVQIQPKDAEARFALAETLEKLENWQGAAAQYAAILGDHPEHEGALLNLGRLYLLGNNDASAREHAEKILEDNPGHNGARVLLAGVEAKAGNRDRARELIEAVLADDPTNPEAASMMSSLLLVDGKVDDAVAMLAQAIAAHPDEIALRINLARLHARAGNADAAVETFRGVIEHAPDVLAYRNALARLFMGMKQPEEAEKVLRQAVTDFPEDTAAKLALVEFLASTRGAEAAEAELERLIAAAPQEHRYGFALGKLYEAANRMDDAAKVYAKLVVDTEADSPDQLSAKSRLAVVRTRQEKLDEARKLVEEVLAVNARDVESLLVRGTLRLNDGDAPGAIADFRTVLRDAPDNVGAVRLLARAHVANKEPDLALDVLERGATAKPGSPVLGIELANVYAARGRLEDAIGALDAVLERNPADAQVLQAKFNLYYQARDWDKALGVTERMKSVLPEDVRGYHFAGLVRRAQGDFEASIGEFQSALDRSPRAVEPLSEMVKSLLALKRRDDAKATLERVAADIPDHFVAANLLGELELAGGDDAAAETHFRHAMELNPRWAIPYRNLAAVMLKNDRRDDALALMKQGIEATGGSNLLVTGLAGLYEQSGDLDLAIAEYEKVLAGQPDSALAANNLAMVLAEYRDDPTSLERARELVRPLRNSNQPAFLDTVGWVEYKLGDFAQAQLFLEKAVEAAPDAGLLHFHLGMALHAAGNAVGAREHLRRALDLGREFKGAEEAEKVLAVLGDE